MGTLGPPGLRDSLCAHSRRPLSPGCLDGPPQAPSPVGGCPFLRGLSLSWLPEARGEGVVTTAAQMSQEGISRAPLCRPRQYCTRLSCPYDVREGCAWGPSASCCPQSRPWGRYGLARTGGRGRRREGYSGAAGRARAEQTLGPVLSCLGQEPNPEAHCIPEPSLDAEGAVRALELRRWRAACPVIISTSPGPRRSPGSAFQGRFSLCSLSPRAPGECAIYRLPSVHASEASISQPRQAQTPEGSVGQSVAAGNPRREPGSRLTASRLLL